MSLPFAYRLKRPNYWYSNDGSRQNVDKLRGLLSFGPLRAARISEPKCLFVFPSENRDQANQLFLALRNGIGQFPGCKRLTGVSITTTTVEPIRIQESRDTFVAQTIANDIEKYLTNSTDKPDFAFIINRERIDSKLQDPYHAAKATFFKHGIPSQYVSLELFDSAQFKYAMSNIALSVFVKLGGVPWSVSLDNRPTSLVFGIGHAETVGSSGKSRQSWIGYATCVLTNGLYLSSSFFPAATSYDQFLSNIGKGLSRALDDVLTANKRVEKVTIHISRLEKRTLVRTVEDTLRGYQHPEKSPVQLEIVQLTADSDFAVYDLAHTGYVSEEGTVVSLGNESALLVAEGRREASVWRGRKPVTLELKRQYTSSRGMKFRETIEDAFYLSSVNWRGFNAMTQPISLQYSRLIAEQLAKIAEFDPNIIEHLNDDNPLTAVPWFI